MLKFYEVSMLKRNDRSNKSKYASYDIVIVKHSKISDRVVAKIGAYNLNSNILIINIFRLVYWFSKNVYISYKLMRLFNIINIFDKNNLKHNEKKI